MKALALAALIALTLTACQSTPHDLPTNPVAVTVEAPITDPATTPVVRCEEDMPCWDCKTMGNLICGPVEPAPVCYEDMPCWDCATMGNLICGPVAPVVSVTYSKDGTE